MLCVLLLFVRSHVGDLALSRRRWRDDVSATARAAQPSTYPTNTPSPRKLVVINH